MNIKIKAEIEIEDKIQLPPKRNSIALLLGAGFSCAMGYPLAKKMNELILKYNDYKNVCFTDTGKLGIYVDDKNINTPECNNEYQKQFEFCKELIKRYDKEVEAFDYEKFYDFIYDIEASHPTHVDFYNKLKEEYDRQGTPQKLNALFDGLTKIYSQMVQHLLKDKYENNWYNIGSCKFYDIDEYNNFLNFIKKMSDQYDINVHTINHDLLFESFNSVSILDGMISDGFSENCSEYYGKVYCAESGDLHIRLEKYTGEYNTPIRLYKLHGSLDYVIHKTKDDDNYLKPTACVKLKKFINVDDVTRSTPEGYDNDPFNYHPEFLTGVTSKIVKYETFFFKDLLDKFVQNLIEADKLIVIGYGFKDPEINYMISHYFDYNKKNIIIIDKTPSEEIHHFKGNNKNVKLIEKSITDVELRDFE